MADKYRVKKTVWMGGRRYEAGTEMELEAAQARTLVQAGKIEAVGAPVVRKSKKAEGGEV